MITGDRGNAKALVAGVMRLERVHERRVGGRWWASERRVNGLGSAGLGG
jgi:hypothetical protein